MASTPYSGHTVRHCCAYDNVPASSAPPMQQKAPDCVHCGTAIYALHAGNHVSLIPDFHAAIHASNLPLLLTAYVQNIGRGQSSKFIPQLKLADLLRLTCAQLL